MHIKAIADSYGFIFDAPFLIRLTKTGDEEKKCYFALRLEMKDERDGHENETIVKYINKDGDIVDFETRFFSNAYSIESIPITLSQNEYGLYEPYSQHCEVKIYCKLYAQSTEDDLYGDGEVSTAVSLYATGAPSVTFQLKTGEENNDNISYLLTGNNTTYINGLSKKLLYCNACTEGTAYLKEIKINNITQWEKGAHNGDTEYEDTFDITAFPTNTFTLSVKDTRGYSVNYLVTFDKIIPYTKPQIYPIVKRPTQSGDDIQLYFNGTYFSGYFRNENVGYKNTIKSIECKFKEKSDSTYSDSVTVLSDNIYYDNNKFGFAQEHAVSLKELFKTLENPDFGFDYRKEYIFEVSVSDGVGAIATFISTTSNTVSIARGTPSFDWGENDFNFNVPVRFSGGTWSTLLDSSQNLNDINKAGVYAQGLSANCTASKNYPDGVAGYLEVFSMGTPEQYISESDINIGLFQRYTTFNCSGVFIRCRYHGMWSSWTTIYSGTGFNYSQNG